MTNLDSILKSRDITLSTKVCLVIAMVFPVVMYGCEGWTVKQAEHQRIGVFELWCWGRLFRVPWAARKSSQSILKEIVLGVHWKDWCWNWNSNTLTTWCKELTHLKRPWCWERLRAGEGDNRGWDGWLASPTWWTWVWVNSGSWWWTGRPGMLWFMGSQSQTRLSDWTELRLPISPNVVWILVSLFCSQLYNSCFLLGLIKGHYCVLSSSPRTQRDPWTQSPGAPLFNVLTTDFSLP